MKAAQAAIESEHSSSLCTEYASILRPETLVAVNVDVNALGRQKSIAYSTR